MKKIVLSALTAVALTLGLGACAGEESVSGGWDMQTAYAHAQELGFEGSLEEFLQTVRGEKGEDGKDGKDGKDGVSVVSMRVSEAGNLIAVFSNGKEVDLGKVTGEKGKDGVGIRGVEVQEDGSLLITYTDGNYKNLGVLASECEHAFGAWQTGFAPTCTSIGYDERTCADCGGVEYRFSKAEHEYGEWREGKGATCTSIGYHVSACAKCGDMKYAFTDAKGHSYGQKTDILETCEAHLVSQTCTSCGEVKISSAPVVHRYEDFVCTRCGKEAFNDTYGFEELAVETNGKAMQAFYLEMDEASRAFHADASADASADCVAFSLDYESFGLTGDEATSVWKIFKLDKPLYYWIDTSAKIADGALLVLTEKAYATGQARVELNAVLYEAIEDTFVQWVGGETDPYTVALACHDAIVRAVDYAYDGSGNPQGALWAHSIEGVFTGRGAVCEGYAKAFQLLLNFAGVENRIVTGQANGGGHAWNMVRLDDGNWYWCDLTWDDIGARELGVAYNYFCVSETENTAWQNGVLTGQTKTFADWHTAETREGVGSYYLYDLPQVSREKYIPDGDTAVIKETFRDGFFAGYVEYSVFGYGQVNITKIDVDVDTVGLPAQVEYKGKTYDVVSAGGTLPSGDLYGQVRIAERIKRIDLPATLAFVWDNALRCSSLEYIDVDENNPYFTSKDGVLYTKSGYTLVQYPFAKGDTVYEITDETYHIANGAFGGNTFNAHLNCELKHLEKLVVGKNVKAVGVLNWGAGYADGERAGVVNLLSGAWCAIAANLAGEIAVDGENAYYKTDGFGVYSKSGENLYCVYDLDVRSYTLPKSVRFISNCTSGISAFAVCRNLEEILVEEGNASFSSFKGVLYTADETEIVSVPIAYKNPTLEIAEGVETLGVSFAYGVQAVTSLVLPTSIQKIEDGALLKKFASAYYKGTQTDWEKVVVEDDWIERVKVYFYSETQPQGEGAYWRYDEADTPVVW